MHFATLWATGLLIGLAAAQQCGGRDGSCPRGACCSTYGWCGTTNAYCGDGCQSNFGTCSGKGSSGPGKPSPSWPAGPPSAVPGHPVSQNGECGAAKGRTCLGSEEGNCCSQYNYCGKSSAYCGKGCQSEFGSCDGSPASSSGHGKPSSSSSHAKSTSTSQRRSSSSSHARSTSSSHARSSSSSTHYSSSRPTRTPWVSSTKSSSVSSSVQVSSSSSTTSSSSISITPSTSSTAAPTCTPPLTPEQLCEQGVPGTLEYRGFVLQCNDQVADGSIIIGSQPQPDTESCLNSCIALRSVPMPCDFAQYDTATGMCLLYNLSPGSNPAPGIILLGYSGGVIGPPPVNSCPSLSSTSSSSIITASSTSSSIVPSTTSSSSSDIPSSTDSSTAAPSTTSLSIAPSCTPSISIEEICATSSGGLYRGSMDILCGVSLLDPDILSSAPQPNADSCADSCLAQIGQNPPCGIYQYDPNTGICILSTQSGIGSGNPGESVGLYLGPLGTTPLCPAGVSSSSISSTDSSSAASSSESSSAASSTESSSAASSTESSSAVSSTESSSAVSSTLTSSSIVSSTFATSSIAPSCTPQVPIEQACAQPGTDISPPIYRGAFEALCNAQWYQPTIISSSPQPDADSCFDTCIALYQANASCLYVQYVKSSGTCFLASAKVSYGSGTAGVYLAAYNGMPIKPVPSCSATISSSTSAPHVGPTST